MLRPEQARRLGPYLRQLLIDFDTPRRMAIDPIEFPHRYSRREDIEVVALVSACLAYGRVDLFRPKLEALFAAMGRSPADFAAGFKPTTHGRAFEGFVYRFNVGTDLALLIAGAGAELKQRGTLESGFEAGVPLQDALSDFAGRLRGYPQAAVVRALGPPRGLEHLLPEPTRGGTSKRLLLFLRWMARGPDGMDFGLWRTLHPSRLVIPLDTHIARMSRHLGLTTRTDATWQTAVEITDSLRLIDPDDPVRFDFVLCHFGMSGACPLAVTRATCAACPLCAACKTGRRRLGRKLEEGPFAG